MNPIRIIYRKELREIARDKRVLYSALIGPIFLVLLITQLMSFVERSFSSPKAQKIHYVRPGYDSGALKALENSKTLQLVEVESAEKGTKMVEDGRATLFLEFPATAPEEGKAEHVKAVFDEKEQKSEIVLAMAAKAVAMISAQKLAALLMEKQINPDMAAPIQLKPTPIKQKETGVSGFLASFLPYLIVIWAFYGGFSLASDSVAGEKERQTLETLLISPVSRRDLVISKFLVLTSVGITASFSSFAAVVALGLFGNSKAMFPSGFFLTPAMVGTVLLVIIPLSAMFAGLLLAISAFSKNTREAQTYLSLLSFVVLMPAVFSQIIGLTDFARARWVSFVPVLNSATVLRESLLNKVDPMSLIITVGLSLALASISIWLAVRMFHREQILVRS